MLLQWLWLIPLLPLLAAFVVALRMLLGRDRGDAFEPATARISGGATLLAWLGLVALAVHVALDEWPGPIRYGDWLTSGELRLPITFHIDRLALGTALVLGFLIWLTHRFAAAYLHREAGFHRFYFALNLFGGGMLLILLAGNAFLAFVGWELAGISSWLLIGYAYQRPVATGNALRALVTNRIGDAAFILGIAFSFIWLGGVEWQTFEQERELLEPLNASLLVLAFTTAALAKSAQLPFSAWLGRALEGPTPSSAVFYGAVMVHAGVYLLLRLEPLLQQTPALMAVIAGIGLLTALYAWLCGLVQSDVKSALVFATQTQVGLMFVAIGLGLFEVAAVHLALHAVWRAHQFLTAPGYMHQVTRPAPPAPAWLRRRQWLYTAALQRFWLDPIANKLLLRTTQTLGRDMRAFDDGVVSRLVGLPEQTRAAALLDDSGTAARGDGPSMVRAHGLAGAFMAWLAERLHRFELRLVLQPGGGVVTRLLHRLGEQLVAIETLLEQPRYLLLLVMATLVVIL